MGLCIYSSTNRRASRGLLLVSLLLVLRPPAVHPGPEPPSPPSSPPSTPPLLTGLPSVLSLFTRSTLTNLTLSLWYAVEVEVEVEI